MYILAGTCILKRIGLPNSLDIYVLIFISLCSVSSAIEYHMTTYCHDDNEHCFHLYNRTDLTTWQIAYDTCLAHGLTLAVVPDIITQKIMEQFSDVSLSGQWLPHAWVAGRRSENHTWTTMDHIEFKGPIAEDVYGNMSCSIYHPSSKSFYSNICRQDTAYLNLFVCQYKSTQGCLDAATLYLNPMCYKVKQQTVDTPIRTWNGANQRCQDTYPGGTLAYSNLYPGTEVRDYISWSVSMSGDTNAEVWVGIRKQPWVWVTETTTGEIIEVPFDYTKWWNQEGASADEHCVHLELKQNSAWADKDCNVHSPYFVCEEAMNHGTTTVVTTTTTQKSTTRPGQNMVTTIWDQNSMSQSDNNNATESNEQEVDTGVSRTTAILEAQPETVTIKKDLDVTVGGNEEHDGITTHITSTTTSITTGIPTATTNITRTTTTTLTTTINNAETTPTTAPTSTTNILTMSAAYTISPNKSTSTSTPTSTTSTTKSPTTPPTTTPLTSTTTTTSSNTSRKKQATPTTLTTAPTPTKTIHVAPVVIQNTTQLVVTGNVPGDTFWGENRITSQNDISEGDYVKKTASVPVDDAKITFIIAVVTISGALIILVIVANVWDIKHSNRKKPPDIYFGGAEDSSSVASNFNAEFSVENGIENGGAEKSTISHINLSRISTTALRSSNILLQDHETSSLAINPAYSSCSEQDSDERFDCPDVVSHGLTVGRNKDKGSPHGSVSSACTSLIRSLRYSDVSYGRRLDFAESKLPNAIYDEIQ